MTEERKLLNQIRKELIDGSLGNADHLLRYELEDAGRVYYVVPSRNKSIFLVLSSPLIDDTIKGDPEQHFITVFKIFKTNEGMRVKGLTKIPVTSDSPLVYRHAVGALIRKEFHNARSIVIDESWLPLYSLKESIRGKLISSFIHGKPVLSEKQLRDLNNQRNNIQVHKN